MRELSDDDRITITVNGRETQVFGGLTILQALDKEGIEVPSLCHDIRLKRSNGSCGLCVVEVGETNPRDVKACLTPVRPMKPTDIRAIREREHLSQPVFARYLNVSKNLVSDWERGVKKPSGAALRLLTVVQETGLQAIA